MSRLTSIQSRIQTKVFNNFGSTFTHKPFSSTSIDKWGDRTDTYSSSTTITGVPFNLISKNQVFEPFGDLNEGETDVMFPYSVSLNIRDSITFDGVEYIIKLIEKYPFADGNLAFAVRLAKKL